MSMHIILLVGLWLAGVGSLAQRVVTPGSMYDVDSQTWDQATADAWNEYEMRNWYNFHYQFPRNSWSGAMDTWKASIRVAADVPTKDPALSQAGTSLYLTPEFAAPTGEPDYASEWYMCVYTLRVTKSIQGLNLDEECVAASTIEQMSCDMDLARAAYSSFDWANGTATFPCRNFTIPKSCEGLVDPRYFVIGSSMTAWDPNVLRYSSESHHRHAVDRQVLNDIITQAWSMLAVFGWSKDLDPATLRQRNQTNSSTPGIWPDTKFGRVCIRAGQAKPPLSHAVAHARPSMLLFAALVVACVL
ncbi:hypothetical protein VTK56DRAFT_7005 [Thermocarpiscus australiensis]